MTQGGAGRVVPGQADGRALVSRLGRWIGWTLAAPGLAMLLLAAWLAVQETGLPGRTAQAEGTVLRMQRRDEPISEGGPRFTYAPVVAFTTPEGRRVEVATRDYAFPPCCRAGERVSLRYDPADPDRAWIPWSLGITIGVAILAGVGSLFLLIGVVARRILRRIAGRL